MIWAAPWDDGIRWRTELVTPPSETIVDVEFVRERVLRVANGTYDDDHIESLILAATALAEEQTHRAIRPQRWKLVLSGFPSGRILLPRPPLIEIESFTYIDGDGEEQSLSASPAAYVLSPSGFYSMAAVSPLESESWPATQSSTDDAVEITYRAGYQNPTHGACPLIVRGIELAVSEMYDTGQATIERYAPWWREVAGG